MSHVNEGKRDYGRRSRGTSHNHDDGGLVATQERLPSCMPPNTVPVLKWGLPGRGRRFALGSKAGPGPDPNMVWTPFGCP